jgi:hypothetical protein
VELARKGFGLQGSFEDYGSSNEDWREQDNKAFRHKGRG